VCVCEREREKQQNRDRDEETKTERQRRRERYIQRGRVCGLGEKKKRDRETREKREREHARAREIELEREREREREGGKVHTALQNKKYLADVLAQDVHESHVLWRREESHLRIMQVRETRKESARARASHRESARGHVTWHGKFQLSSRHTPSVRRAISCSFNSGLKIQERNSW
jgi:hypothetical protein